MLINKSNPRISPEQLTIWAPTVLSIQLSPSGRIAIRGLVLLVTAFAGPSHSIAAEPLEVEVEETSGIARFGYPVTGAFLWPENNSAAFRLLHDDRPIEAQFSQIGVGPDGAQWEVDFNLDLLPFEKRTFRIEPLAAASGESRPKGGMVLERDAGTIRLRRPGLDFEVPENLLELLKTVKSPQHDYFVSESAGFFVRDRQGERRRIEPSNADGQAEVEIVKAGPLCAALKLACDAAASDGQHVKTSIRLDFPRSKSWVRAAWTIDDQGENIASLGAEFQLRLTPDKNRPTLVDFGAPSSVYATLQPSQLAVFRASPPAAPKSSGKPRDRVIPWLVTRGTADRMLPYVAGQEDDARPAEGWAHVMDDKLCTAIAVDRFARETSDRIEASADGRVQIWREYGAAVGAKSPATKTLVFWLHFVPSPPHVGAVTSPQSMQSPPFVRVVAPQ